MEGRKHHFRGGVDATANQPVHVQATSIQQETPSTRDDTGAAISTRRPRPALDAWLEQVEAMLANEGPATVAKFAHLCVVGRK